MGHYVKISFNTVKQELEKILGEPSLDIWEFLPDQIHQLAKSAGVELDWTPVKNWTGFEYGYLDISDEEFLKTIFKNSKPLGRVMIVTDDCFEDKKAFQVEANMLVRFISDTYPDMYDLDFFQPNDYIFVCPDVQMVAVLHHVGFVMQYESEKKSNRRSH